jgi:hypothetical protein
MYYFFVTPVIRVDTLANDSIVFTVAAPVVPFIILAKILFAVHLKHYL